MLGYLPVSTGYVFTREDGSPLHPDYITRHFEWLVRKAGLPPVRLHVLRHGASSLTYRATKDLKAVQSLLGAHQDAAVLRPILRELAGQAHLEGGNGFTYGLLHAAEAARAERAEHELPSAWKRMRKRKNTAWLMK